MLKIKYHSLEKRWTLSQIVIILQINLHLTMAEKDQTEKKRKLGKQKQKKNRQKIKSNIEKQNNDDKLKKALEKGEENANEQIVENKGTIGR